MENAYAGAGLTFTEHTSKQPRIMKTFRSLKAFTLAICASFVAVSCIGDIFGDIFGPSEPSDPTPDPPEEITYTIKVTPAGPVQFPAEGGSISFTATTNADNTTCSYPKNDWLTVAYDKSSKVYVATAVANDSGSDREFELKFYAKLKGSDEKVATIVVKATQPFIPAEPSKAWVKVTPSTLEIAAEGGSQSTVITWSDGIAKLRNVIRESDKSWISSEWKDADGKKYLVVTAAANDTGKERSGIIDVYGGFTSEDINYAVAGSMDASRSAVTQLTVSQPAGSGQGSSAEGSLSGYFSVNGSGRKVSFSKGNLQYQASTNTWRFADKQWDYVGNDNSKIGKSYSGWIDLFGWGTSGYNCGNDFYHPYDYTLIADHINDNQYGPKGETSLTGSNAKSDWGVYNAISNGGKKAGLWRTITHDEFDYLIFKRSTSSGIRYAKANVNNVNGLILFPDNWSKSTYSINEANEGTANYSVNKISSSNWTKMENAGCVFLPAAGMRTNDYDYTLNHMQGVGTSGEYWTASGQATLTDADHLYFHTEGLQFRSWPRCEGRSVRLVRTL